MKKLTNFLKNFAIDYVIKYLTNNKDEVVAKLNKEINVTILNEKQDKEVIKFLDKDPERINKFRGSLDPCFDLVGKIKELI